MTRFKGKVAFITGGASGLGLATAQRLADEGAKVVLADINLDAAKEQAARLPDAIALQVDTSDPDAVERSIATAVERYEKIDIIFNNAGISGEQLPIDRAPSTTGNASRGSTATASSTS